MKQQLIAAAAAFILSQHAVAQDTAPGCGDLVWSAQVLAANPDIGLSCRGVYERNNEMFAKVRIELTRVRGNRLTFRPEHVDGSMGVSRSITVGNNFRADIDGRKYRARELTSGQQLDVYIPEDRFALAIHDGAFDGDEEMLTIEDATVVAMPKTASPLFAAVAAGLGFLGIGALLSAQRRLRRVKA